MQDRVFIPPLVHLCPLLTLMNLCDKMYFLRRISTRSAALSLWTRCSWWRFAGVCWATLTQHPLHHSRFHTSCREGVRIKAELNGGIIAHACYPKRRGYAWGGPTCAPKLIRPKQPAGVFSGWGEDLQPKNQQSTKNLNNRKTDFKIKVSWSRWVCFWVSLVFH